MALRENTPPSAHLQKLLDELHGVFPDLSTTCDTSLKPKYNFRAATREKNKLLPVTSLDQDESVNFDPNSKVDPLSIPVNRKRRERRERLNHGTPKRLKTCTWQLGRWTGDQMSVVLKFTTDRGRAALRAFGDSLNNWPQVLADSNSSDQLSSELVDFDVTTYDLRARPRNDQSDTSHHQINLKDITLGHPAARGCVGCIEVGLRCPLLDEGSKYPCIICQEDDVECELVMEPTHKRTCEGCRRRRQRCSYGEEGIDHSLPCEACVNAQPPRKCIAGPASGRTRTGPSLDNSVPRSSQTRLLRPRRTPLSCTQRRRDKTWCSNLGKSKSYPCGRCSSKGTCCFVRSPSPPATEVNRDAAMEVDSSRKMPSEKRTGKQKRAPLCRTITTRLAHPIAFNYVYEGEESAPCHWCEDLMYGLLGLPEVEVEVIDSHDGQGYIEVIDGHLGNGIPPSRMCEFCTLERLRITACAKHDIEPIEGMDPEDFDTESVMDWIAPGMADQAPFPWCTICPNPAFSACCTEIDMGMGGQEENLCLGDMKGCGLLLCESCTVSLVNEHEGKLDGLIDELKKEKDGLGELGIRADADFLHSKGELLRRMAAA